VKKHVSRQVWALIHLQLLTAARGGELLVMRAIDLDTTGRIWVYRPATHKTAHHGKERGIYIGAKAKKIVKLFLKGRPVGSYLFNPREAERERHDTASTHRRANQKANLKKTDRVVRDRYDSASYRRAIERACDDAGIPRWTRHRLRHSAETFIRKEFGLEAAQLLLGHARTNMTELYAEKNEGLAKQIAGKIG